MANLQRRSPFSLLSLSICWIGKSWVEGWEVYHVKVIFISSLLVVGISAAATCVTVVELQSVVVQLQPIVD